MVITHAKGFVVFKLNGCAGFPPDRISAFVCSSCWWSNDGSFLICVMNFSRSDWLMWYCFNTCAVIGMFCMRAASLSRICGFCLMSSTALSTSSSSDDLDENESSCGFPFPRKFGWICCGVRRFDCCVRWVNNGDCTALADVAVSVPTTDTTDVARMRMPAIKMLLNSIFFICVPFPTLVYIAFFHINLSGLTAI